MNTNTDPVRALDYTPGRLDETAPERIWLQIDTAGNNADRDLPFPDADGVTWEQDSVGGLEIQYVRADLASAPPSATVGVEEMAGLLEQIRDLLASLPVDCLGTDTAADGQPYPIRDEVIHGITKALAQQPAAGEEIMVNAAHDVYTLPLQPSGLLSGPRFVVHVPAPEQQPAAPSGEAVGSDGRRERLLERRNVLNHSFGNGAYQDGRVQQQIDAIDAELAALAAPQQPAGVFALEVFRIAGGDTECEPNPTPERALEVLRDLRACYDEALAAQQQGARADG